MDEGWKKRKKTIEEEYFLKQNKEALKSFASKAQKSQRLSPVTGEAMQEFTVMGITIDYCPSSKGIWLDAGELEDILALAKDRDLDEGRTKIDRFLETVLIKTKH